LLREGQYLDWHADELDDLGAIYYFCKGTWAAHTNNVLNYTWSHDEHSPVHEIRSQDHLDHPEAHDQKGRLALFATTVALGQPMYFMGQEFNLDRPRNVAWMDWPEDLENHGFYQWARRVIRMRRRYPGLRLDSYDPAADGLFTWLLGPWLPACQGEGRRLLGWRITPSEDAHETMVILLSFESEPVVVDIQFGLPGTWVCLADLDRANDLPPEGDNSAADPRAIHSKDGWFRGFTLPPSSGFLYKWETA
ncbi:MAG: 1,4-alpha-glucan branching protein, partial [Armatimonadetes bacterium]|nr:1,4-alpha-glucan branching protein [Armatimonadota bacterium]